MAYDAWDDFLVHRHLSTMSEAADEPSRHPKWTDRFYFNCHARDGTSLLTCGYGVFPNQGIAAGYAMFSLADGRHWRCFAHRRCPDVWWRDVGAGPLRFEVVEPLKRWRLLLGDNPSGMTFDIEYEARAPIWELEPIRGEKNGKIVVHQRHIQQSAYYRGVVRTDGEPLCVDGFYGSRDRTWGVRDHDDIDMWIWFSAQFESRAIAAWVWERKDGSVVYVDGGICGEDGSTSRRFVSMEHDVVFDGALRRHVRTEIVLTDEDGRRYVIHGTGEHPHVVSYYGRPLEPSRAPVQGESWNGSDPAMLEAYEANAVSADQLTRYELDGEVGYGIFELYVSGDGYDRYAANWKPVRVRE